MNKLVCIEKYWSIQEAYLAKAQLENGGVIATVTNTSTNGVLAIIAAQLSPIELMVHECNANEAKLLLGELTQDIGSSDNLEWKCTKCGETSPATFATCWSCGSDERAVLTTDSYLRVDTASIDDSDSHGGSRMDANSNAEHDADPYVVHQLTESQGQDARDEKFQSEATEKAIERAWRAAIVGLVIPITCFSFYSLYLLLRYGTKSSQVSRKHNVMFLASLLISVVVAGATIAILNFIFASIPLNEH